MSDFNELLSAIVLLVVSFGMLIVFYPRNGRPRRWLTKPVIEPSATILIVTGFAIGAMLLLSYFTTLDNLNLSGQMS